MVSAVEYWIDLQLNLRPGQQRISQIKKSTSFHSFFVPEERHGFMAEE